jgi:hypothetical protein
MRPDSTYTECECYAQKPHATQKILAVLAFSGIHFLRQTPMHELHEIADLTSAILPCSAVIKFPNGSESHNEPYAYGLNFVRFRHLN